MSKKNHRRPIIHIIEIDDMRSLLRLSNRALLKIKIGNYYIFYNGEANENFIGLHIFISDRDYKNYLSLDQKTDKIREYDNVPPGGQCIPVCTIRRDLASFSILYTYLIKIGYIDMPVQKKEPELVTKNDRNKTDST